VKKGWAAWPMAFHERKGNRGKPYPKGEKKVQRPKCGRQKEEVAGRFLKSRMRGGTSI